MRRGAAWTAAALAAALMVLAPPAAAQLTEVQLDRGASSELYIRRRPATPEPPKIPDQLERLLREKEKQSDAKRTEAIGLLRAFLASKPSGDTRAEGLFKLAELLWEEARQVYVTRMNAYERKVESCRQRRGSCAKPPAQPRLDLSESETLYRQLLADHPDFRRTDLVLYLVGFAAREGERYDEALGYFQQVIQRFPRSPLYGDSWMMIGEFHFAKGQWEEARRAYANILSRPDAPTYDLALFKTAWADWRLGDVDSARKRFKEVLDLAAAAQSSDSERVRKKRTQLRDQALEYLVIVFTEDQSIGPKEIYEFLASIGGERYSRDVLVRVAEAYKNQSEYDRSVNTYRFLIEQGPVSLEAAAFQRTIVEAQLEALDEEQALRELAVLVETYGPASDWAKENRSRPSQLERSQAASERLVRVTAKNFHAEAQQREKSAQKTGGKARLDEGTLRLYRRAADTYALYLGPFGQHPEAAEVRFLRAEILFFKLERWEEAGDEYLRVGKTAPVGELHKDALLKAMSAFEQARPKDLDVRGKRELLPVDRKFAEAVDLYATLFPADDRLVEVIFRNGQMFYDYGDYDEAIKRFGLIVTKYPDNENAGPAGDRILTALAKGEDYENIEDWARKLKQARAFQSNEQQARLDRLIVESIGKSGEKYADAGKYEQAAGFYLRVPKEFPKHPLAAQSLFNAALMLEKAKRPEEAGEAYLSLADRYPSSDLAAKAAFTAGGVFEAMAYFDRAAEAYEVVIDKFGKSSQGADALFNAGVLRQALGQHERAIAHYGLYAKRFKQLEDAEEVAFRVGAVYEAAGDDGRADRAFRDYARRYKRGGKHLVQAHSRAGRSALRLGQTKRAQSELAAALALYKKARGADKERGQRWAAEARYLQGELVFRDYEAIKFDVAPNKLERVLDRKAKLLEKATDIYLDVVDFGDYQWATAALYRIGRVYEEFALAMREAPVPKGLDEDQAERYRMALDDYIVNIEARAIELYERGYQKALEMKVYNQYTKQIREALGRLAATSYPPEREVRPDSRIGDRPLAPDLVKEVIREAR